MVVNRTVLWGVIVVCCVPGVAQAVRLRLREGSSPGVGAWVDGIMTGLGAGLGASCVVLALTALAVRLG
jgi:hypothetical protein